MTIQDLYDKRNNLVENARKFLEEHTDDGGMISAEDAAAYDKMEVDVLALEKQIERFKNQEEREAQLSALQPLPQGILNQPGIFGGSKSNRASDEYRKAAVEAIRSKFRHVSNTLATNPDTSGGYLIPDEWDSRLIETLTEECIMRSLATVVSTSGEHKINFPTSKPTASWVAEGGRIPDSNATFGQVSVDAYKVSVKIWITEELLADAAFPLEDYILEKFGEAIANAEEEAFIVGNGTGKPTGFLTTLTNDTTTYITTKGTEPTADEIIDLIYKLPRAYRKSASFLVNDSTLGLLRKFKDQNQRYLWEESYQAGEPSSFMGYKIYTSPYMPTVQSGQFPIAFGDFKAYNIFDRGTRSFQELRELHAENDEVGFLMKQRVDGLLIDKSAIRALKIK